MQNVIIVGDQGVGKSAFVRRLTTNTFTDSYIMTMTKDMYTIEFRGRTIALHDHGGSPRYQTLRQLHYKHADGALVFCDHELNIDTWIEAVKKENPDIPIVIVMNKADDTTVNYGKGADIYISCKENRNLENVLPLLVPKMKEPEAIISPLETLFEYLPPYCSIA